MRFFKMVFSASGLETVRIQNIKENLTLKKMAFSEKS
jgi:hypothetical protein